METPTATLHPTALPGRESDPRSPDLLARYQGWEMISLAPQKEEEKEREGFEVSELRPQGETGKEGESMEEEEGRPGLPREFTFHFLLFIFFWIYSLYLSFVLYFV